MLSMDRNLTTAPFALKPGPFASSSTFKGSAYNGWMRPAAGMTGDHPVSGTGRKGAQVPTSLNGDRFARRGERKDGIGY